MCWTQCIGLVLWCVHVRLLDYSCSSQFMPSNIFKNGCTRFRDSTLTFMFQLIKRVRRQKLNYTRERFFSLFFLYTGCPKNFMHYSKFEFQMRSSYCLAFHFLLWNHLSKWHRLGAIMF